MEAVHTADYTLTDPVLGVEIEAAGQRNFTNFARSLPQWRATAYADWSRGPWAVRANVRHISAYDDDENAGAQIDAWTALDLQARWESDQLALTLGALNATNEAAPSVNTPLGYDTKVHDARGRVLYARVSVSR